MIGGIPQLFPGPNRPPCAAASAAIRALGAWLALLTVTQTAVASQLTHRFETDIQPLLETYCYDCHADGMEKGKVSLDTFSSHTDRLEKRDLWLAVLKNLRTGLMPPAKKKQPTEAERERIAAWIKNDVFQLSSENPDPGRVTLRRLNRVEYQNTIRDLMGVEFKSFEEFPPDDTGYGFDTVGDVLNVSPLLLEKYLAAAETIVTKAVPTVTRLVPAQKLEARQFRTAEGKPPARRLSFYEPTTLSENVRIRTAGDYRVTVKAWVFGAFDFDPGKARATYKLGDQQLHQEEYKWQDRKELTYTFDLALDPGERPFTLQLEPLVPVDQKKTSVDFQLDTVTVEGPLAQEHWQHPPNYSRFFARETPPTDPVGRDVYAREVLGGFAEKAYRQPVDAATVDRLMAICRSALQDPDQTFEKAVARSMVAVLASPRFLFRIEGTLPAQRPGEHPMIDEYALASRLSYFLWSTMPDDELFAVAARRDLRKNLGAQVKRMMADPKSSELVVNFVGQWLQARDVEGVSIDARAVLARETSADPEADKIRARFFEPNNKPSDELTAEEREELTKLRGQRQRIFRRPRVELDEPLRKAMRRETEMLVEHVIREDRPLVELLNGNYTFLNERLAKHYGIPDVTGDDLRRVELPPESPRGGLLTQGTLLTVTSNPTRTSPVKRGLFLLENFLGTPPPPPPEVVPQLEESESAIKGHEPTLREVLEVHRSNPLCNSCHSRMDPLGLALENFNALGLWREKERGQPLDVGGQLITGEPFSDIRELKQILATRRHRDFYHCLAEKLLTYALGRGPEYVDVHLVESLVQALDQNGGRFSTLLSGVIESPAFQRRRAPQPASVTDNQTSQQPLQTASNPVRP